MKITAESLTPLTHTTYYILLALTEQLHGYGIMQKVDEMSKSKVKLGPGTLYGALSKLEKQGLIVKVEDTERKKCYILTDFGKQVVTFEFKRIEELVEISRHIVRSIGGDSNDA
ncbi:PadR family transcriptional regulator [Bacillus sp. HMF5848]|uniref:PadR family transcriptional regulator n=1 Tax=Bacillus sp. HMF5848 TaxID=2495421 RepID=UPI000F76F417|nr:PadR family transcriptional regulator [Bacillus sp. HMF5848]RSK28829.1 PadR family transcriptional regulator [Bacillus sp. HMF5848]